MILNYYSNKVMIVWTIWRAKTRTVKCFHHRILQWMDTSSVFGCSKRKKGTRGEKKYSTSFTKVFSSGAFMFSSFCWRRVLSILWGKAFLRQDTYTQLQMTELLKVYSQTFEYFTVAKYDLWQSLLRHLKEKLRTVG